MGGINIKQSGGIVVLRAGIDDNSGNALGTGTATLRVCELQADGTLKQLDFGTGFVLRLPGASFLTPTASMVYQAAPDGVLTTTGLYTFVLTAPMVANFTVGKTYIVKVTHSGVAGAVFRNEWQYGGVDGDLVVDTSGRVTLSTGNGFEATVLNSPAAPTALAFTVSVPVANSIIKNMQIIGGPGSVAPGARFTIGQVVILTSTTATITVSTDTPLHVGFDVGDVLTIG